MNQVVTKAYQCSLVVEWVIAQDAAGLSAKHMTLTQSKIQQSVQQLKQVGIIAIMRGDYSIPDFLAIAETLIESSVSVMEITLNSSSALQAIGEVQRRFGEQVLVGAGTVRTAAQVEQAAGVGAQFIVSPNFDPASVAVSQAHNLLHLPGVATASEAQNAFAAGCTVLKLFPADLLGGPAYIKALRAPLDDIEFAPTGGINAQNAREYKEAGAVAVGIGSWLVPKSGWSKPEIAARARALRAAWSGN